MKIEMRALWLSGLLLGCGDKDTEDAWLLVAQDLGTDRAQGTGFSFSDTQATWNAVDQITPGLHWNSPALDLATTVFDTMLDDQGLTDDGTCPYTVADGPTLTWVTNCRSQDGYQLDGTVSRTDGDEDGRDWRLWEFDLEVTPDTDFPDLQRVSLQGKIYTTTGSGDDALIRALQANVVVGVEEYYEAVTGDDTQQDIWSDWALSARYELQEASGGTQLLMQGATDLGSLGGFTFGATELLLPDSCPTEFDGTLDFGDASITFDGSNGCDQCGALVVGGDPVGDACAG